MERIIKAAVDRGASDLHIKAGDVFRARIDGRLVPLTKQALTAEQTRAIALGLLPTDADRARVDELTDHDCSWAVPGLGRFRVNIMRQRGALAIVRVCSGVSACLVSGTSRPLMRARNTSPALMCRSDAPRSTAALMIFSIQSVSCLCVDEVAQRLATHIAAPVVEEQIELPGPEPAWRHG